MTGELYRLRLPGNNGFLNAVTYEELEAWLELFPEWTHGILRGDVEIWR